MSGARIVQYGRKAKHRIEPESPPEPSPKRQKVTNGDADSELLRKDRAASRTPTRTYSSRSKPVATFTPNDSESLVPTRPSTPEPALSPSTSVQSLTRTPSTKPKDLSQIFAPLPQLSASPSHSPGKSIAKRMLVRARTEPSLPFSVSPKSTLAPASSLPTFPTTTSHPDDTRSSPPSPSPTFSKPTVRTYSQSRSFLVALPVASTSRDVLAANPQSNRPTIDPDDEIRESYTDLRTRWGVDNSEDDPHYVPGITNELMSMTELRSKGESRRFLDEVGYLFEGLEEPGMSTGVKRSSAVEIVLKMCNPDFVRKAKAADFIGRAWDAMRLAGAGNGDKVLDPCLAFFVALVARNRRDADDLARRDGFFTVMIRLLETSNDYDGLLPHEDPIIRKMGLSKAEKTALMNLRNIIMTKSELFTSTSIPSTCFLVSFSLSSLTPDTLPAQLLRPLLASLLTELSLIGSHPNESSLNRIPNLEHIEYCLRILDAFLLGAWGRDLTHSGLEEERDRLGTGLISLCATAAILESDDQRTQLARQCIESAFRVLINLSHASLEWCTLLLRDPAALPFIIHHILPPPLSFLKREEENGAYASALDRQCLALGLLTNMVFAAEETRDRIREMQLDLSCPRGRRCMSSCQCTGRTNAIECLTLLFIKTDVKSESSTIGDLDFFRCHLAALLCLLTTGNSENQHIVQQALPEVGLLSASVHQFLDFYANMHSEGDESPGIRSALVDHVLFAHQALET